MVLGPGMTPTEWEIHKSVCEQLNQARKTNAELHRRAQRLEGIEEHLKKVHEGYRRNEKYIRNNAARKIVSWTRRYRAAVDQIVAAGVPDHVVGKEQFYDAPGHPRYREGRLDVMIERLIWLAQPRLAVMKLWKKLRGR